MKETMFDVLMYLFENYMDSAMDVFPDDENLLTELTEAGFEQSEVSKAFAWLDSLGENQRMVPAVPTTFRVFSDYEQQKLDLACRNFLLALEHNGILSASNREWVIDRAMALDGEDLSLDNLKWIVLMILFSQPDEELAFSRLEDMVFDLIPEYLH
ncbi:MAG: DUF494 domain-containing protein [Methylococcales bacterium]|nr:DUF494 domain-containing protein [Methylococcales bacterium]